MLIAHRRAPRFVIGSPEGRARWSSLFSNVNLAGTFIWERCDGERSLAEIVAARVDDYKVTPEEAAGIARNLSIPWWSRDCCTGVIARINHEEL
jgi:hypothetical protein